MKINHINLNRILRLSERLDYLRLQRALRCDNLPIGEGDVSQRDILTGMLLSSEVSGVEGDSSLLHVAQYRQCREYGRYHTRSGIQRLSSKIRNYVCAEYYQDVDMVSAHTTIIHNLFRRHGLQDSFLDEYNTDRAGCIKRYGLGGKLDIIVLVNSERLPHRYDGARYAPIREFHRKLYANIFSRCMDNDEKTFLEMLVPRGTTNRRGCMMAHFLQNIENTIIMQAYEFMLQQGLCVGVLMYDGLMVERDDRLTEQILRECEAYITDGIGYNVTFAFKQMAVTWEPQISTTLLPEIYRSELAQHLMVLAEEDRRSKAFIKYMNQFVCMILKPHSFGFRKESGQAYDLMPSSSVRDILYAGDNRIFYGWLGHSDRRVYDRVGFNPDIDTLDNQDEYNTYVRPLMKSYTGDITDICPLFFDFLKTTICDNNANAYDWVLNWVSQMLRKGKTGHAIVLLGPKGTGKSSFSNIIGKIIGDRYYIADDDIEALTRQFNGVYETNILTAIQEIQAGASEYHKVQNKIKSLISERTRVIERKGLERYVAPNHSNFIFMSNEANPIKITKDNRRFLPLGVSSNRMRDTLFFGTLLEEVNKHVGELRYFFTERQYDYSDNYVIPETAALLALLELNKSPIQQFMEESVEPHFDEWTPEQRKMRMVYESYKTFCVGIGRSGRDVPQLKYFRHEIETKTNFYFQSQTKIDGHNYKNLLTRTI